MKPASAQDATRQAGGRIVLHDETLAAWRVWRHPDEIAVAYRLEDVGRVLERLTAAGREGRWAVGFLAYEASAFFDPAYPRHPFDNDFPLAFFAFFAECEIHSTLPERLPDANCGRVRPATGAANRPASSDEAYTVGPWRPELARQRYDAAIAHIQTKIAAGETYQVNYTFRQHATFTGEPYAFFRSLVAAQAPACSAFLDLARFAVCSVSPELFFKRQGQRVVCRPMKGTAKRGLHTRADQRQRKWLAGSAKNRAENLMIVDMVRNDLGRVATPGSVRVERLFEVERYPSVWQMTSLVSATTAADTVAILTALFPSASITGAPKVQTMRIIDELESSPRGLYTGTIGFVAPDGDCQFNVAIRTTVVDRWRERAEYGVGGGIVWDSTANGEYAECLAKTAVLTRKTPEFSLLEALLWTPQSGWHLFAEHLRRLADSAEYFAFPYDRTMIANALQAAVADADEPLKVRLALNAKGGVRVEPVAIRNAPVPPIPRVGLALAPVASDNLFLYHKTSRREIYNQALAACPEVDDVVLWNERGELTETCTCNIVLEFNGESFTPPIDCGLLAGIERAKMLAEGRVRERRLTIADFHAATAIQLVNSVRGRRQADKSLSGPVSLV